MTHYYHKNCYDIYIKTLNDSRINHIILGANLTLHLTWWVEHEKGCKNVKTYRVKSHSVLVFFQHAIWFKTMNKRFVEITKNCRIAIIIALIEIGSMSMLRTMSYYTSICFIFRYSLLLHYRVLTFNKIKINSITIFDG